MMSNYPHAPSAQTAPSDSLVTRPSHIFPLISGELAIWSGRECQSSAGFFFSAEISKISPKTGFIGDHRYFLIPDEIFRYS
jgi:hypothetical protein